MVNEIVSANQDAVRDWISLLHGESAGLISIVSTGNMAGRTFTTDGDGIDAATDYVMALDSAGEKGIYLRCTTLREAPRLDKNGHSTRGGIDLSFTLPGLWADIDIAGPGHAPSKGLPLPPTTEAAQAIVEAAGLAQPSLWVHSGGGLYAWWLFNHPVEIRNIEAMKAMAFDLGRILATGADKLGYGYGVGTHDLARVLRIPGTVNRKVDGGWTACRQLSADGAPFTPQALKEMLQVASAATPIPKPAAPKQVPAQRSPLDGERPGDEFARVTPWADILEPAGWSFCKRVGDEDFWTRPGKPVRDGHSASTREDGCLYIWSTETGLDDNTPLSKLYVYAYYNHAGDMGRAASELRHMGMGSARPVSAASAMSDFVFDYLSGPMPPSRPVGALPSPPGASQVPQQRTVPEASGEPKLTLRLTPASQFKIKRVRWLWAGRAPLGEMTLIPGREGVGKSLVLASLASGITRGTLPGEFFRQPRTVIYCASEDSWNQTIAPRMLAAGADMNMVFRLDVMLDDVPQGNPILPRDCAALAAISLEINAACWMLDPIVSLIDGKLDSYKAPELRMALEPLRRAAEKADAGILALAHFNKASGVDVSSKVAGSRAWLEVARAAISIARMPSDEDADDEGDTALLTRRNTCVVSQEKNNLGRTDLPNLTYEVGEVILPTEDGEASVGKIVWTGETAMTAGEAMEGSHKRQDGQNLTGIVAFVKSQYRETGRMVPIADIVSFMDGEMTVEAIRKSCSRAMKKGLLETPVRGLYRPPMTKNSNPPAGVPT